MTSAALPSNLQNGADFLTFKRTSASDETVETVDFEELMARIRHLVITRRLRIKEFLQDFDTLRTGSMKITQFRRCMSTLGLSGLGQHLLTEAQFDLLMERYRDRQQPDKVRWMDWMVDIESVVTLPGLEQNPTAAVPPTDSFIVPPPGTIEAQYMPEDQRKLVADTLDRLRTRVSERKVACLPTFRSFDPHNHGHVTRQQFMQCLAILELHANKAEMDAMAALFANDKGINYRAFLSVVEPQADSPYRYPEFLHTVRLMNSRGRLAEKEGAVNFEAVLEKVKIRVYELRLRMNDIFKDFDKLRSGYVPRVTFRRAIGATKIVLLESELSILEEKYAHERDPQQVNYARFVSDVEALFAEHALHRTPLYEPSQFKPMPEHTLVLVSPEGRAKAEDALARLAEQVRKRRLQLFPLFEDFDRVHNGSVTPNQFRRVLTELDLNNEVNSEEADLLSLRYAHKVGVDYNVNYLAFADEVYHLGGIEPRLP